jgi:YVTN family beta-propeller protein
MIEAARANALLLLLLVSTAITSPADGGAFVNFETPVIHGLALSPDGKLLAVCNLPDGHLEIYSVTGAGLSGPSTSVFVGLDPVSVRFQSSTEAWVVNHLSDSIAIVDVVAGKVTAILNTLESPEDVVFAGTPRRA